MDNSDNSEQVFTTNGWEWNFKGHDSLLKIVLEAALESDASQQDGN